MITTKHTHRLLGVDCLDLNSKSEEVDNLRELANLKEKEEDIKEELNAVKWISALPLMSDFEAAMSVSKKFNINVTEALKGRSIEETYMKTLNTRDFGFNPVSEYYPGQYAGVDPSTARSHAFIQGMAGTAGNMASAHIAGGG